MSLLLDAIALKNTARPPVWFMRQAGRYHSHYQKLKLKHTFMELCKVPELAAETTFGPIQDFDFDAAILFSDLLFPLEVLGFGLEYAPGPKMGWHLRAKSDLQKLNIKPSYKSDFKFQGDSVELIRKGLASEKALIGFVGAPLTLYSYAVEGSHQGELKLMKEGLNSGLFNEFAAVLNPVVVDEMCVQAAAGAEVIAVFDTCAGDLDPVQYREFAIPALKEMLTKFKSHFPNTPVLYYSKGTTAEHWQYLRDLPIQAMGVDWNTPIVDVLKGFGNRFAIQGNFNPDKLLIQDPVEFEKEVRAFFKPIQELPKENRKSWICGLGHGVLQTTPERNVKRFIEIQKEIFA